MLPSGNLSSTSSCGGGPVPTKTRRETRLGWCRKTSRLRPSSGGITPTREGSLLDLLVIGSTVPGCRVGPFQGFDDAMSPGGAERTRGSHDRVDWMIYTSPRSIRARTRHRGRHPTRPSRPILPRAPLQSLPRSQAYVSPCVPSGPAPPIAGEWPPGPPHERVDWAVHRVIQEQELLHRGPGPMPRDANTDRQRNTSTPGPKRRAHSRSRSRLSERRAPVD
jgi:hypothetical protein